MSKDAAHVALTGAAASQQANLPFPFLMSSPPWQLFWWDISYLFDSIPFAEVYKINYNSTQKGFTSSPNLKISYDISYMQNLKRNDTDELIYKTDSQTY